MPEVVAVSLYSDVEDCGGRDSKDNSRFLSAIPGTILRETHRVVTLMHCFGLGVQVALMGMLGMRG